MEQAAVPGSSDPSGQSQELSLIWDDFITMDGWPMQAKVSVFPS
jgi:hypothetical protein